MIDVQTLLPFDLRGADRRVAEEDQPRRVPRRGRARRRHRLHDAAGARGQGGYSGSTRSRAPLTAKAHRPAYGSDGDYFSKPNREDVFDAVYELMHEGDRSGFRCTSRAERDTAAVVASMPSRSQRGPRTSSALLSAPRLRSSRRLVGERRDRGVSRRGAVHARIEHLVAAADGGFWAFFDGGGRAGSTPRALHGSGQAARGAHPASRGGPVLGRRGRDRRRRTGVGGGVAADRGGRAARSSSIHGPRPWRLRVFDPEGEQVADPDTQGTLLGLTGDGAAWVPHQSSGTRSRGAAGRSVRRQRRGVLSLDRAAGDPPTPARHLPAGAAAGRRRGVLVRRRRGGATTTVGVSEPPGERPERGAGDPIRRRLLADSGGGTLFVAGGDGVQWYRPGADGPEWVVDGKSGTSPRADDGAWVLTGGPQVLRLLADGSSASALDPDTPPPGMTFAERGGLLGLRGRSEGEDDPERLPRVTMSTPASGAWKRAGSSSASAPMRSTRWSRRANEPCGRGR